MKYALASLFLWCAMTLAAFAHEVRPAYLELRETAPEIYDVLWKVPARGENLRLALYVRFPADARNVTEPRALFTEAAYVERWRIQRSGGLAGQDVTIEGLPATKVDALIRVTDLEGVTQTTRATPDLPTVTIAATASRWQVAGTYLVLGIEHILLGIDHLLFVLALVLLVQGWRKLVATITAFTVAHSITLALATLGFVHVPGPPVEACIALSIVFVAAEIIHSRQGRPGLTAARPVGRRVHLRLAARTGLRRRAERSRSAAARHPGCAALLQRRRGTWPARFHRGRAARRDTGPEELAVPPALGTSPCPLLHRQHRHVLVDRADRCIRIVNL